MNESETLGGGNSDDRLLADCRRAARRALGGQTCRCGVYSADEAVQEAIAKALRDRQVLASHPNPHAYIVTIAKHVAIDHLRTHTINGARGVLLISVDDDVGWHAGANAIADPALDPERLLLREERRRAAIQALSRLSNAEREVAIRKYVLEESEEEIKTTVGASGFRIRNMLRRVRKKLRQFLRDQDLTEGARRSGSSAAKRRYEEPQLKGDQEHQVRRIHWSVA